MFKFVHCADLHLDSPLRGLSLLADAPEEEIRGATRKALVNLVDLCIAEHIDFLVIAGDVYDGDWEDYHTGLFFNRCMARLRDAEIPVYLIRGNHDAASQITRRLTLPDNVTEFPTEAPTTVLIPGLNVAIHGQSFAHRAITENLAAHYPAPEPWHFNIGMLHTCAEGQEGHERYAPCSVTELVNKGYQYWALGHIHKRQVLHENPHIIFPGNIQGRHIRESGSKGCTLVTVDGMAVQVEHRDLDVLRWAHCEVDVTGVDTEADFTAAVEQAMADLAQEHGGYRLAVRVTIHGQTSLHGMILDDPERIKSEVQNAAMLAGGDRIWLERVQARTEPEHPIDDGDHSGSLGALLDSIQAATEDDAFLEEFLNDVKSVQLKIREYTQRPDATVLNDTAQVVQLVDDARDLLLTRLQKGVVER